MRFLKGLNDQYSGVRFQILLMSPLPPITTVFSLVVQQERQFNSENNVDSKALAASTATAAGKGSGFSSFNGDRKPGKDKFSKGQSGNGGKVCSYCGKNGHMVNTCFKKHGFPPYFNKGLGSSINQVSSDECENEDKPEEELQ